jgi:hypothetical protein
MSAKVSPVGKSYKREPAVPSHRRALRARLLSFPRFGFSKFQLATFVGIRRGGVDGLAKPGLPATF